MTEVRELERIGYRAPLGLRCRDGVTGQEIGDGLVATAWWQADPADTKDASPSPYSGLLGFGSLPGPAGAPDRLRVRAAAGAQLTWPAAGPPEPYLVRIVDRYRRYLPVLLATDVPPGGAVDVALYSAPARPCPSGFATVRGQTRDAAGALPLPWCVVEVDTGADVYPTVSDDQGLFLLYLPYPEALPPLVGSLPYGDGLGALTWQLTVRVRSQPGVLVRPPGSGPGDPPERGSIDGQAAAQIEDSGPQPDVVATLTFGMPVQLRLRVVPA